MIEEIKTDKVVEMPHPLPQGIRAGDYVYTSGCVAVLADGTKVLGDFEAEARAVLDNVRHVVEAAGGTLADVCKTTVFLGNTVLFPAMNKVYREYFQEPFPARSTILAPLSDPDLRIEIEAVAYIPQGDKKA
ncbi:RidA family protein [Paenarthrobacter sp. RAF54_2]|uniref:RidA family protein n=1 Tax=Paenarthrobacter sp. RAF54_2 TaxID=3233061 RepID=UPI003F955237